MIKPNFLLAITLLPIMITGCSEKADHAFSVNVRNPLDMDRSFETVSIELKSFDMGTGSEGEPFKTYKVIDAVTGKELVSQSVDSNEDGIPDLLLFQPEIKALAESTFKIIPSNEMTAATDTVPACYSRFVPERIDDYAWENNRVAFRAYGPTAQKMVEEGIEGGTLSSGIDAWLKRVDYPIINKWYKKESSGSGSYHEDTGEGLDNFHVGASRGVGGIAVKVDTSYYTSKNFVSYKTRCIGPVRTSFILTYGAWDASGKTISEVKKISLDYGNNLSRFEVQVQGTDTVAVGLALHENDGITTTKIAEGWASYWEPHEASELGTGIVSPSGYITGFDKYLTHKTDESNLYSFLTPHSGMLVYYAGFGWKKSGQFQSRNAWEAYLGRFAQKINNPLVVTINKGL